MILYFHVISTWRWRICDNNSFSGAWCAGVDNKQQHLEIDFRGFRKVTKVATQGRPGSNDYVESFKLSFSLDGNSFEFHREVEWWLVCANKWLPLVKIILWFNIYRQHVFLFWNKLWLGIVCLSLTTYFSFAHFSRFESSIKRPSFCHFNRFVPANGNTPGRRIFSLFWASFSQLFSSGMSQRAVYNSPFPSSGLPLSQRESSCKTFHMKMSLICMKMNL